MKKYTFLLTIIALSFVSAFGQNTIDNSSLCTNQTAENISSRDIKLGMSQEEVLNIFADNGKLTTVGSEFLPNDGQPKYTYYERDYQYLTDALQKQAGRLSGFSATTIVPKNRVRFDGIARYDLGFIDNRLASFTAQYSKPKWKSLEQFVRTISPLLNLPIIREDFQNQPYSINCGDYTVGFGQGNFQGEIQYFMSVSKNVNEIIRQRTKKIEDEQREKDIKTFKP